MVEQDSFRRWSLSSDGGILLLPSTVSGGERRSVERSKKEQKY